MQFDANDLSRVLNGIQREKGVTEPSGLDGHRSPADDLLIGAKAIAGAVYGSEAKQRKIFYLVAYCRFPHFRLGKNRICAYRSDIAAWIREQIEESKRGAQRMPPKLRKPSPSKKKLRPTPPHHLEDRPTQI